MGIKDVIDKGKELAEEHAGTVKAGLEKAEELADKATGGKFSDKIIAAGDRVEKLLPDGDERPTP